jgi:hypothetical protein
VLVAAYAEANAPGQAAVRFEGRLIEALHVVRRARLGRDSRRTVALADAVALLRGAGDTIRPVFLTEMNSVSSPSRL